MVTAAKKDKASCRFFIHGLSDSTIVFCGVDEFAAYCGREPHESQRRQEVLQMVSDSSKYEIMNLASSEEMLP